MSEYDPEAEQVVREWLALVDAGRAAESWAAAAALFRSGVGGEQWTRALEAARTPFGAVVERTLREGRPMAELPGAPDGEYVVFQFDTRFEHKRAAVETITPMREEDGRWRVSGYFIR